MTSQAGVRCPFGGPAPCFDDLCRGVDHTICGLELGFDFCEHGFDPETCQDCRDAEDEPPYLRDLERDEP